MKSDEFVIQLKRKINIQVCKAQLSLKIKKKAGPFYDILNLAKENNGFINEQILCDKFFFSKPMAQRTIKRCRDFNLISEESINDKFKITQEGLNILKDKQIFRYENGKFRLYYTDDPLITQKIITIQRISKEFTEKNEPTNNPLNFDNLKFENLFVGEISGEDQFLDSNDVLIEKIYPNIVQENSYDINLFLEINSTKSKIDLRIYGSLKNKKLDRSLITIPENLNHEIILLDLLENVNLKNFWDNDNEALRVPFKIETRSQIDYQNFTQTISIKRPVINNFGAFNSVTFKVPVIPLTEIDCLKWQKFLLRNNLNEICTQENYNKLAQNISKTMRSKCKLNVALPSQKEFAHELLLDAKKEENLSISYGPRSSSYWYLQTALDLN